MGFFDKYCKCFHKNKRLNVFSTKSIVPIVITERPLILLEQQFVETYYGESVTVMLRKKRSKHDITFELNVYDSYKKIMFIKFNDNTMFQTHIQNVLVELQKYRIDKTQIICFGDSHILVQNNTVYFSQNLNLISTSMGVKKFFSFLLGIFNDFKCKKCIRISLGKVKS